MSRPDTFAGALRLIAAHFDHCDGIGQANEVQTDLRAMANVLDRLSNLGIDLDTIWQSIGEEEECEHEWLSFVGVDPHRECTKCGVRA